MNVSQHPIDREEVMAYLDGELPTPRAAVVVAHLEQCADCRTLAADLRGVSRQMAVWQVEPPPATLAAPELAEPRTSWQPARHWRLPRWAWVPMGAASAAVVLIVIGPMNRSRPTPVADAYQYADAGARALAASAPAQSAASESGQPSPPAATAAVAGPMMARTATLHVLVDDVESARTQIDRVLRERKGYVGELSVEGDAGSGRALTATLRVPSDELEAALAAVRSLGKVLQESVTAEDVLEQSVDLQARLTNARATEQRLTLVLQNRTGRVADILEVEREIARVRGEIERLDAQRKNLETRVAFAIVRVKASEAPTASLELGALPTSMRLRNALVDGYREALETALDLTLVVLEKGPSVVLWLAILAWPARLVWRRFGAKLT